jgi:chromate reductase
MSKFKILAIPGSLRKGSYNLSALRAAQQLAPPDVEIEIFDLHGIPPFSEDDEQNPAARVTEFKRKIREAEAILFSTPEYNYSIPGVLKNAIDWGSRPYRDSAWTGKPVALMGASVGVLGSARAQYHLRQVFVFLNVHALNQPELMIANASQKFDAQGNLTDEKTKDMITRLITGLVDWTKRLKSNSLSATP